MSEVKSSVDQEHTVKTHTVYTQRVKSHWPKLETLLRDVYQHRPDLDIHLEQLQALCRRSWYERPPALKQLDHDRPAESLWYNQEDIIGASLYVDLFAKDIQGLRTRLDYLVSLGVNYIHLMPIFTAPKGNSDGGYAVSSFREVNPLYGHITDLTALADDMRQRGMTLVLDFIFNHTSDEHIWAQKALAGDTRYLNFYRTFDDRDTVEGYQAQLRDIFPTIRPGSFTWNDSLSRWVWTSFNSFQWDLNYANPDVFIHMAAEMLFLANCGIDVLRLDAVAFIWKRLGTNCENLPEAHKLIQAFNLVCRLVAPTVVFKSEAIVHPDDVRSYIAAEECQLSYNPNLMALLWESAATRQTALLERALSHRQVLTPQTNWVNYLRCHDDIGWCFDDQDARSVGIDPFGHRLFLNAFYSGQFPGSFARGVPFQYNPVNQDMRICGTLASLIGVEEALESENAMHLQMALARAKMLYGILMSIGGIPLIYLGEELGLLNQYSYQEDPHKVDDSRWVHRIAMEWSQAPQESEHNDLNAYFWDMLSHLIRRRKSLSMIAGTHLHLLKTTSEHVLAYLRPQETRHLLVIANFSEHEQILGKEFFVKNALGQEFIDHLSDQVFDIGEVLPPYAIYWLEAPLVSSSMT